MVRCWHVVVLPDGASPVPEVAGGGWWQLRTPWRPPCETQCQLQSHLCHLTSADTVCPPSSTGLPEPRGNIELVDLWDGLRQSWEPQSPMEEYQLSISAEIPAPDMKHLDMSGVSSCGFTQLHLWASDTRGFGRENATIRVQTSQHLAGWFVLSGSYLK